MRVLIIIILNIVLFSSVQANTIFNLIKIPNLEIYNSNAASGIKYLKPFKDFKVGIGNNNVSCSNTQNKHINKIFPLIEKNLLKYDKNFLKKINLKFVVLCQELSVAGIGSAGVPNHLMKTLILDINFDPKYFERVIHHEIFHLINDTHRLLFDEKKWINLNYKNFKYAKCSTCSDKLNLALIKETKGFLTEYSMTTPSEDMAEIFSFLITNQRLIKEITKNDTVLKKKVSYLKKQLSLIDKNLNL
tara:strand:+ start:1903 stop:2640 length:738 start_codon:yes stop_codon:yes gene_type:complete